MKLFSIFLAILASGASEAYGAELETVPYVDVSRYLGNWYQIARNPLPFEGDCYCARQQLTLRPDGNVGVYNSCNNGAVNGPLREISGFATNDDPNTNARFTIDFNLPRKGQYWIIGLHPNYQYAVVSDPSRRSLYILSKTPALPQSLYTEALEVAGRQVSLANLQPTVQEGCAYPASSER